MPLGKSQAVAALAFLVVQASSATAFAGITFTVGSPTQGEVEGTSLGVSVVVNSTYSVQSVSAQVGTVAANLTAPSSAGQPWTGTLAIGALSYGSQTLTVTATDALNNTASTTVSFFHDNPPSIQVAQPASEAVARPTVTLAATCSTSDPSGCVNFQAAIGSMLVTGAGGSLNQTIDLTAYVGQALVLTLSATDSNGQSSSVASDVYVDTSSRLTPIQTVDGYIFDFDASRLLYCTQGNAVIRDRQTQADTVIGPCAFPVPIPADQYPLVTPPFGHLTSTGAAWFASACSECAAGYYWTGAGQAQSLGSMEGNGYLGFDQWGLFAGDWTLLPGFVQGPVNTTPMILKTTSLTTGTVVTHTFQAVPNGDVAAWALAANGDVFILAGGNSQDVMYRDHGGTVTSIGPVPSTGTIGSINSEMLTDGVNLLFGAILGNGQAWLDQFSIAGGAQQLLSQATAAQNYAFTPQMQYQANAGWTAFVQVQSGVNQVWSASPAGVQTQLSVYNTNSNIDALGPSGEVMFLNGGDVDAGVAPGRYLRMPPALPELISSPLGTAVAGCDGWYVKMGGTLFSVTGTEDAGTGCPAMDAGTMGEGGGPTDASGGDGATTADGAASDASKSPGLDATTQADGGPSSGDDGGVGGGSSSGSGGGGSGSGAGGGGCAIASEPADLMFASWVGGLASILTALALRRSTRRRMATRSGCA